MDFSSALADLKKSAESKRSSGDSHYSNESSKRPRHHEYGRHYNSREHALRKALVTMPHYRPSSTMKSPGNKSNKKHLCLLFITIDELPFEDIWKEWATNENGIIVSVMVHAKFPSKVLSEFVKQRMLVQPPKLGRGREYAPPVYHTRRPEWGTIEITRAMLDLLHEGLKIGRPDNESDVRFSTNRYRVAGESTELPPVDKFIFCSETCIPVTTLQETASALFDKDSLSWVNGRDTPNNGYSRQMQFEKVDEVVPKNCIYKADQWMMLSRPHAIAVMEIDRNIPRGMYLWECFAQTKASDELYFPTALSLLGIMPSSPELERRRVTYADWSESARNPASFCKGVEDLKRVAAIARSEGCLFARKFTLWDMDQNTTRDEEAPPPGRITVEEWKECMSECAKEKGTGGGKSRKEGVDEAAEANAP